MPTAETTEDLDVDEEKAKKIPKLEPLTVEKYRETLKDWLYIEDDEAVDVIMAAALDRHIPGDPVWLFVIAPPGGTKTELLRSLKGGDEFYTTSKITSHSLISGKPGAKKKDLLPKLDGKAFIIKDFTTILANKDELVEILSQLRDAYDGYMQQNFGSGVGQRGYHSSFGLIAGVTPAVDMYHSVQNLLGERFLKLRIRTDEDAVIRKAQENAGREKEMRKEITDATDRFLSELRHEISSNPLPEIDDSVQLRLQKLARTVALFRSGVQRDRNHTVMFKPEPEIGTRLVKQIKKLVTALAIVRRKDTAGEEEYKTVLRVGRNTVDSKRSSILEKLYKLDRSTTSKISSAVNLPTKTTREALEDPWALQIVGREGEGKYKWKMKDYVRSLVNKTGFFTHRHACGKRTEARDYPGVGMDRNNNTGYSPNPPKDVREICEVCMEESGLEKPAVRKVRMGGEEKWLCKSCLQAAGYEGVS